MSYIKTLQKALFNLRLPILLIFAMLTFQACSEEPLRPPEVNRVSIITNSEWVLEKVEKDKVDITSQFNLFTLTFEHPISDDVYPYKTNSNSPIWPITGRLNFSSGNRSYFIRDNDTEISSMLSNRHDDGTYNLKLSFNWKGTATVSSGRAESIRGQYEFTFRGTTK